MIDGLIKKKIPVLKGEEVEYREVGFFFGVVLLKYIKEDLGFEITDLVKKFKDIKNDISGGTEIVVKFVYLAHKGWMKLQNKEPEISVYGFWFAMNQMKFAGFLTLFEEGLTELTKSLNEDEGEKGKFQEAQSGVGIEELEKWGLGVLGLSRYDFYSCTLRELKVRIEGFILRETEIKNIGARRIATIIYNGLQSFGKGTQLKENKFWPMSIDQVAEIEKSEELVSKHKERLQQIWPDLKWQE